MDKKYVIFENTPEQGRLETIAEQLKEDSLVAKIKKADCGLIITYAGSYDDLQKKLGTLPENVCVEPLGTARER